MCIGRGEGVSKTKWVRERLDCRQVEGGGTTLLWIPLLALVERQRQTHRDRDTETDHV